MNNTEITLKINWACLQHDLSSKLQTVDKENEKYIPLDGAIALINLF